MIKDNTGPTKGLFKKPTPEQIAKAEEFERVCLDFYHLFNTDRGKRVLESMQSRVEGDADPMKPDSVAWHIHGQRFHQNWINKMIEKGERATHGRK